MSKDLLTLYIAGNWTQKQLGCFVPTLSPSLKHRSWLPQGAVTLLCTNLVIPLVSEKGRRDTGSNVHPFYY